MTRRAWFWLGGGLAFAVACLAASIVIGEPTGFLVGGIYVLGVIWFAGRAEKAAAPKWEVPGMGVVTITGGDAEAVRAADRSFAKRGWRRVQ